MKPTEEQATAVSLFETGNDLALNAFAGTGKTATLNMMAEANVGKGLYLAFNRAIAAEARQKFPTHVQVSTSHAVAFHSIRQQGYSNAKMTATLNTNAIASIAKTARIELSGFSIERREVASIVRTTLSTCLLYTSPSPRDATLSRMPSSA